MLQSREEFNFIFRAFLLGISEGAVVSAAAFSSIDIPTIKGFFHLKAFYWAAFFIAKINELEIMSASLVSQ